MNKHRLQQQQQQSGVNYRAATKVAAKNTYKLNFSQYHRVADTPCTWFLNFKKILRHSKEESFHVQILTTDYLAFLKNKCAS